jgi:type-F conjugative transfer system secretin TraK
MYKLTLILMMASTLSLPCEALHILPIKDHETTEIEISNYEHTRISVENDRITQLFGIDGRVSFEVDELNGQVFITPSPDLKGNAVLITVTTEKGLTHDLRIKPTQKPADAILLRPHAQSIQGRVSQEFKPYEKAIVELVEAYLRGKNTEDYQFTDLEEQIIDKIYPELELTQSRQIHSPQFIGKVYQVKNEGEETLLLSPHDFVKFEPFAIAFQKRDLKPSEQTEVLIIVRKKPS